MAKGKYLTSPPKITTMPPGVPYIIGNEAAERFSYYGMNGILTIFMSKYLMDKMGNLAVMPPHAAEGWYHTFVSTLYILPIFGAFLADALFGKFKVVLLVVDRLLRRPRHPGPDRLAGRARDRAASSAGARTFSNRARRRRHQALCFYKRRRPIWRVEQAFAHSRSSIGFTFQLTPARPFPHCSFHGSSNHTRRTRTD